MLDKTKDDIARHPRRILYFKSTLPQIALVLGEVDDQAATALEYMAEISVSLANCRCFDGEVWTRTYVDALSPFVGEARAAAAAMAYKTQAEQGVEPEEEEDLDEDVENLCDCTFSLAYGSKILLNNTHLKLKRGFKYGLMGANQCGKTTLLQAIANEQVEGFPPPTEVKTMFMATDIHADDSDMTVIDYIKATKHPSWGDGPSEPNFPGGNIPPNSLAGVGLEEMINVLDSVGFVKNDKDYTGEGARQSQETGQLSGGWRMKLALSRAILMKADIMLMV